MIKVNKLGILLQKTALPFEIEGVLNPGVIKVGEFIHLFYRAVAKNNYSSIGYCKLSSPTTIVSRGEEAILLPEADYECHGLEDPRIVKIEGTFYMSYTVYDGFNALGALATSSDLIQWKKIGIIVPQIQYDDFKQLVETKGSLHEKYIRFNEY